MASPLRLVAQGTAWAGALVLLIAMGACAEPTPTATVPPLTATPEPSPTPTVHPSGGILTIATRSDPPHYDVHQTFSPALHRTGPGLVYSRLLRFRSDEEAGPFSLQLECDLCEGWEQVDGVTYRFVLRKGVRWHDLPPVNGRELTADDIIFSYERQSTPGWENAGLLRNLEGLTKVDDYTLEIRARVPDADFLASLADGHSKIVPREAVQEFGNLRKGPPIGTGPWQWVSATRTIEYRLERNPYYYEEGVPEADRLEVQVIPDAMTRFAALLLGTLDVAEVPSSEVASLGEKYPQLGLMEVRQHGQGIELVLNTSVPLLQDLRVRRAVFQALDPWRYLEGVWEGGVFTGLGTPLVSGDWLLPPEELRAYWGDPQQARDLLEQADMSEPSLLPVTIADYGDAYLALAQVVAEDLRAAGFNPEVREVNPVKYVEQVWGAGNYTIYLGPSAPVATPNDYFLGILHSEGSANTTHYQDGELDRLMEDQAVAFDPLRRRGLVLDIQRRLLDSAVRFMLVTQASFWGWQPHVQGFHPNLAGYEYFYYARIAVREE